MAHKTLLKIQQLREAVTSDFKFVGDSNRNLIKMEVSQGVVLGDANASVKIDGNPAGGAFVGLGINKLLVQAANVADDDFLRIDGTAIEGRSAAETLSDIGAQPLDAELTELATMASNTAAALADLSNVEVAFLDGAGTANSGTSKAAILDGSGHLVLNSKQVQGLILPTADSHAANKAYVDSVANGLDVKASVIAATVANIAGTYDAGAGTITAASNGALGAQDGVTMSAGQRLLVKNQSAEVQNGIYVVTTLGDGSNAYVLTRATDFDEASGLSEVSTGAFTFVEQGNDFADQGFVMSNHEFTDLDNSTGNQGKVQWSQFSGAGQITAGNGLEKLGNEIKADLKANSGIVIDSGELSLDLAASGITGTLAVSDGGSGQTSYTDGQLLIGNSSGNTLAKATLTGGSGMTVTNGNGSISVDVTRKLNGGIVDESGALKIDLAQSAVEGFERFSGQTQKNTVIHSGSVIAADGNFAISDSGTWIAADFEAAAESDREIYLNGVLLLEAANAAGNLDWYEKSSGNLAFEFPIEATDIITMVYRKK